MIKNIKKANSKAVVNAEYKLFKKLQARLMEIKKTLPADIEEQVVEKICKGDPTYNNLKVEWRQLLFECSRRNLDLKYDD